MCVWVAVCVVGCVLLVVVCGFLGVVDVGSWSWVVLGVVDVGSWSWVFLGVMVDIGSWSWVGTW